MFDFVGNIKNVLGKFKLTSWKSILVILVILVLASAILYYLSPSRKMGQLYQPNRALTEGFEGDGKNAELIMFHVDWCPHCKTAKPEWESTKNAFQGKNIKGYTVVFTDVNCTNETAEIEKMVTNYKVEGYPTIKMIKDGKVIDFDAKPTQSSLSQFINNAV